MLSRIASFSAGVLRASVRAIYIPATLWAAGAIFYDGPLRSEKENFALALSWLGATVALVAFARKARRDLLVWTVSLLAVILPWLTIRPSNDRDWKPEYSRAPHATVDGDTVTIHDLRMFDYGPGKMQHPRWETRTVHLSNLRGIDLFLNYWGSALMSHPIFSFDFGPEGHVAFSIETRQEKSEGYSLFGGLYKRYELMYIAADERDVVRLRTNYREGEDIYLFKLRPHPERMRQRFMEYVETMNALHAKPRFYNILSANCTTSIRSQIHNPEPLPRDIRFLLNGKLDEMLASKGAFEPGIPLEELRRRGLIDEAARAADADPDFSARIRRGVPGF